MKKKDDGNDPDDASGKKRVGMKPTDPVSFTSHAHCRVLTNSKFGLFYSKFLILTPTSSKVPIEKSSKTPIFSGKQHFYSYFQNPSENSVLFLLANFVSGGGLAWSGSVPQ